MSRPSHLLEYSALVLFAVLTGALPAMDYVTFAQDGKQREVAGRILVEAQDGGLLLEGRDHVMWTVLPDEIRGRERDETDFTALDEAELGERILAKMPPGFKIHRTAHYLICYNTSKAYAQWCGSLYERLHRAFYNFWRSKGLQLHDAGPLVAIVFRDRASYEAYASQELGEATGSIIGYYSLTTNLITSYDLTGVEKLRRPGDRTGTMKHISQMLTRPAAERTVATIVHEATHQLAFNSGLQIRFADNPLWLSEGLAIYFESPDLNSRRGWRRIGSVNQFRLSQMRSYLNERPPGSLFSLISDDQRFRAAGQADQAYAEAWALVYHLIRSKPQAFVKYLEQVGHKTPLGEDAPEVRIQEFRAAFGSDLSRLDASFMKAVRRWR